MRSGGNSVRRWLLSSPPHVLTLDDFPLETFSAALEKNKQKRNAVQEHKNQGRAVRRGAHSRHVRKPPRSSALNVPVRRRKCVALGNEANTKTLFAIQQAEHGVVNVSPINTLLVSVQKQLVPCDREEKIIFVEKKDRLPSKANSQL